MAGDKPVFSSEKRNKQYEPHEIPHRRQVWAAHRPTFHGGHLDARERVKLVNTKDGVLLELERKTSGSSNLKWHIFRISDAQVNIIEHEHH